MENPLKYLSHYIEDWRHCNLGGPAEGMILKARYLTYNSEWKIVDHEMRSVFGMAENCLFKELYTPVNSNAREDARGVIEILNTLTLLGYSDSK